MKVALINTVCGYGSTGRIVAMQADMLKANGHQAVIAYGRKANHTSQETFNMSSPVQTLFSVAMTRLFDTHGLQSKRATKNLLKKLDEFKPDIIHLHNLHGYYININLLFNYIKQKQLPVVWNLHDCWSMTGHCNHFEYVNCNKWQTKCYQCPQKREYPASFFLDRSRKNYILKKTLFNYPKKMIIVTPSQWLNGVVNRSFLSKYPTVNLPTGIDLTTFKPVVSNKKETLGLTDKHVVLGAASVFGYRKGFKDFISLSKLLPTDYAIVLVGLTQGQLNSLPSNIVGLPHVSRASQMAKLFSMADVFVNPTKEDTFPTVNLEALACGIPVVTYDTGGCKDALDETCGVVVPKDNVAMLHDAILNLQLHPLTSKACLKKAYDYDKNTLVPKYLDIYKSLK